MYSAHFRHSPEIPRIHPKPVGRLGTLVSSGNAHALAQGILEALANPPDPSIAQTAMLSQYGIDRLVSDLSALYKALLTKKRRA